MGQTFDDYNETCQLIDGFVAIHPPQPRPPHAAWHIQHMPFRSCQTTCH
jgi:hypothetical protein